MPYSYSNAERAQILVEALPYIKKHNGKIIVIKYGGNAMINETLKQQVMEDIVLLWHVGIKIVLVHGGLWRCGIRHFRQCFPFFCLTSK